MLGIACATLRFCRLSTSFVALVRRPATSSVRLAAATRRHERAPESLAGTTSTAHSETFEFQAEVGRVMDIIVNSLYSNRDVFLRELVSNAADACDKKRFVALTEMKAQSEPMKIRISANEEARTLTIEDNGIGMSKEELIENLGRIARSGTANFVKALGAGDADINQIGQFGVGFYSAFLVAESVEVVSRRFGAKAGEMAWRWSSQLSSTFSLDEATDDEFFGESSGTRLILHLKEDAQEYLNSARLSDLLKKYSEFITFPIELWSDTTQYDKVVQDPTTSAPTPVFRWEIMNKLKPIWLRNPEVVNASEYAEFYRATFKTFDEPLTTTHFKVEGQVEFRALVFVPSTMPFELSRDMFAENGRAMRLYVKRVFINDKFQDLVPRWLTFVRGVIDSEDLPLNVGREILQQSRTLKIIRKRVVRKVLDTIGTLKEEDPAKYEQFWTSYGKYLKVGLVEDLDYQDELKGFVRFWSSKSGDKQTSLQEYVSRMKDGQDKIYFVTGEGRRTAEMAPAMEKMRLLDYEVLYMVDPLDEICSNTIMDFDGKRLLDINKAGVDVNKTEEEQLEWELVMKEFEPLATWVKDQLGDRIQKVVISDRLVDSPASLVQDEWGMSPMMQRYMKAQTGASAQDGAFAIGFRNQAILEINPRNSVILSLKRSMDSAPEAKASQDMIMTIYDLAALSGGYTIDDTGGFAKRVAKLMESSGTNAGT
eukprot:TRINITY_DN19278_c0_g1_i1.p1 TRINITY_DN19278_c0_g1~~TRINITY_DN19278_c0_g1_i1.p1  ORF type:complete len:777 (+),score=142.75 TRINITY_DN19278_c0_g1_i1:204-2333(+)